MAVSPGDGITAVFRDFLVDQIVSGGQTMNPAIEHVLAAIDATPAQTVFVLPNNSNIILTAQMAAKMTDKQGHCAALPHHSRGHGRPHAL